MTTGTKQLQYIDLSSFQMTVESKQAIALYLILVGFLTGSKTGEVIVLVSLASS